VEDKRGVNDGHRRSAAVSPILVHDQRKRDDEQWLSRRLPDGMQGISGATCPDHALSAAADRGRDDYLRPELVEFMLVVVVRPGLCDPAIPDMEHQDSWAANTAPISFGIRAVQPDGMLVIAHHIMEGSPEGTARRLQRGQSAWPALQQGGPRVHPSRDRAPDPESGALDQMRVGATCHQTPSLATTARNCDHIATMPGVTGGDGCPTWISDMAVDLDQRGREGMGRTGGDG
jgi:hypothetical protein